MPGLTTQQACDPRLPHNGDGSEEWLGTVPFDQMPHVVNPPHGYIVELEHEAEHRALLQQNGGEEYWGTIYHSEPIARDLATHKRLSTAELTAIEADIGRIDDADSRPAAPYFLPDFFTLYQKDPSLHTPQRDAAVAELEAWNQRDTVGSVAMSINTQWMQALEQRVFGTPRRRAVRRREP